MFVRAVASVPNKSPANPSAAMFSPPGATLPCQDTSSRAEPDPAGHRRATPSLAAFNSIVVGKPTTMAPMPCRAMSCPGKSRQDQPRRALPSSSLPIPLPSVSRRQGQPRQARTRPDLPCHVAPRNAMPRPAQPCLVTYKSAVSGFSTDGSNQALPRLARLRPASPSHAQTCLATPWLTCRRSTSSRLWLAVRVPAWSAGTPAPPAGPACRFPAR